MASNCKKTTETFSSGMHAGCFTIFRHRASSGLTLVELIVAVSILSTLMAITIPGILSWIPDYRLKHAVKDLYSHMQFTRLTAIKTGNACNLSFSGSPDQYIVGVLNKTVRLEHYQSGVRYGHPTSANPIPTGPMVFGPSGMLNPPSRYAYLSNAGNTDFYRIGALTSGIIRIQRWNGSDWE